MNQAVIHSLNWIDYFIIGVILFSSLISLMRGFISEAISLLTWIAAAVVAFKGAGFVANYLSHLISNPTLRLIVAFLIIFFIILIIGSLLNRYLSMFIHTNGLSGTNRLLGMLFGFLRGVLLIAIFVLFARYTSLTKEAWWQASKMIPYFIGLTNWLQQFIPDHFHKFTHFFTNPKMGEA